MRDQAQNLRDRMKELAGRVRNTRVVAVTSGKGGVGKSNFTLNFALSLIEQGQKVIILDADIGFANLDVLLGISPKYSLFHLIEEKKSIWEIIEEGPNGLGLIAGSSGLLQLGFLNEQKLTYLLEQLQQIEGYADVVVVDTGAGLSRESLKIVLSADEIILVTTPEPTSITDAYAVIKYLHSKNPLIQPYLVVNRVVSRQEGDQTSERLSRVARQFLSIDLRTLGYILEDDHVPKSVKRQEPFLLAYPKSAASEGMRQIAANFLNPDKNHAEVSTGMKGFLQKMLKWIK